MTICIIPARSGSKRIKNKNIKNINGIPLIGATIKIAIKSKLFDRIVVSTDSEEIAKISKKFGAEVPFFRGKKLSDDYTPTYKVLIDCVNKIKTQKEDFHFCLYPTSVLIEKKDLLSAFLKIKKLKANFICPIAKFEVNPLRSFKIKKNFINFVWDKYQVSRSQDLKDLYYDTGSFYIYRTKSLLKLTKKKIIPDKSTYVILKKKLIDINYPKDFKTLRKLIKNTK